MKILSEENRDEFFKLWELDISQSDKENPVPDQSAKNKLNEHKNGSYHYYIVELEEKDLTILLLPHHDHTIKVPQCGMSILEYGEKRTEEIDKAPVDDKDCVMRIRKALEWFNDSKDKPLFLCISDNPELALGTNHYDGRGQGFFYAASSHKFAAYAVWVKKNGFKPIKVYLATNTSFT